MAKFVLDEHISPKVADLMRTSGADALAIAGSPWAGMTDTQVLALATQEGRILVTYNIQHLAPLLADAMKSGRMPPGLVYVDVRSIEPRDYSGLARALGGLSGKIDRGEIAPSSGVFLTR